MLNKRQTHRALSCVMGDGISHQADPALLRHLLHDLSFADSGRSDQQHRALADGRDLVSPKLILCQIRGHRILDFLFCTFDVHNIICLPL